MGWLVVGPPQTASARLQGYRVVDWLARNTDIDARILYAPRRYRVNVPRRAWAGLAAGLLRGVDVVVFQKIAGPEAARMMRLCRALGIRSIYIDCDPRESYAFTAAVDRLVAASRGMADAIAGRTGRACDVIPDPVEFWRSPAEAAAGPRPSGQPARLVWIGSRNNLGQAHDLRARLAAMAAAPVTVTTVSDHPDADIPWRLEALPEVLYGFDAGIIPVAGDPRFGLRSLNRATLFMAVSVPLVVEANTAYAGFVRDGENAFVYREVSELGAIADRLADPSMRSRVIAGGYRDAGAYHIDAVGRHWEALIRDVAARG